MIKSPEYIFGILDNDPKGLTGRGTLMYLKACIDNIEYYKEWSVLDEIYNTDAYKEVCRIHSLYITRRDAYASELYEHLKTQDDAKFAERKANSKVSDEVLTIIDECMTEHANLVKQYKEGKEKALNSLVGKIIVKLKSKNIQADPFNISVILKQKIVS